MKSRLNSLNHTLSIARNSSLYSKKLDTYPKQLQDIRELTTLPFTTKAELREHYPYGSLSVLMSDVIEVHTSSGTTGKATLSFYTADDLIASSTAISEAWKCFGLNSESRVQFMMSYGLFSGAAINTYAIQKLGALVVPSGIQSAEKQIQMMIDFKIDTIVATIGYYHYLYDYIIENNIPLKELSLKRGIAAGEIYSNEVRSDVEQKFNINIFDHYGLCEVNTGIAYECEFKSGLHFLDDYVIAEIIDPTSGQSLPSNTEGELVLTTLKKDASPLIRYRTGDITEMLSSECPCGRKSNRINRIKRRIDDLIFIKGIKIDPYELKEFILKISDGQIYSDIKIKIHGELQKISPEILVTLKNFKDEKFLNLIREAIKDETLVNFKVSHVPKEYFKREDTNKMKFVEYVK